MNSEACDTEIPRWELRCLAQTTGESRIKRALTVLKTRASSHDPRILEFEITSNGIELGEQFADEQSWA